MNGQFVDCSWGKAFVKKYPGDPQLSPIIALHGWLDNHASFEFLSEHLDNEIYAIDLPGHGKSSHLQDGNWYHYIDYIEKTHEVINNLQLEPAIFLGHSMGAAIAVMLAAVFPEAVSKVILIDGLGPLVNDAAEAPKRLRQAILERKKKHAKKRRYFENIKQAAEIRRSVGNMSLKAATALVNQQIQKSPQGYYWSYDPKLNSTSSLRMTPEQLQAFYDQLTCPTLLIEASEGILVDYPYEPYLENCHCLEIIKLHGHHHLHMDSPKIVAAKIKEFL